MQSPLTAYLGVQCNMGDEIYISHEMKTPGLLNIELLKCVWDSILSSALTHIILKTTFFVFVQFPDKATFRTCLGPFRYSKDRTKESLCNVLSSDYREELLASLWITESYSVLICQCIGNMTNMNGRPKKQKRNDLLTRGRGNWDDMKNRTKKADIYKQHLKQNRKKIKAERQPQALEKCRKQRNYPARVRSTQGAHNNRQSPTVELGFRFSETSPKMVLIDALDVHSCLCLCLVGSPI